MNTHLINFPAARWLCKRSIEIKSCSYQRACCMIASSGWGFGHIAWPPGFYIITGESILIIRRFTWCRSHCGEDNVVCHYAFTFGTWQMTILSAVFVLYQLQKGLLVEGSISSLLFRINIHSLVPLHTWLPLPERIKNKGQNEKHTGHYSLCSIIFG